MGSLSLLQWIFLTQELNRGLLHCRRTLYLSYQGSPKHIKMLHNVHHQFSSVTQLCLTLCDPMNRSTPGLLVHHQLPEFTQPLVHRVSDAIQPSYPLLSPFSSCPQSLPASESFPMSQLFTWGGQSIGVSVSASVLPMNTKGLISFRMDWLDLLAVQGTLKSLLHHHSSKATSSGKCKLKQ